MNPLEPRSTVEFLPTPRLDDMTFQQLMDMARPLIARYCPEWTDHNLSDPGITLLELFAHLVDLMLYRLNQVPDKMYIKFLEMLGTRLEPAQPAQAEITFYFSRAIQDPLTIPASTTEVSTRRTEAQPPIIFRLKQDLHLTGPQLVAVVTHFAARSNYHEWILPDLPPLPDDERIEMFGHSPQPGDSLLLGFEGAISHRLLCLVVSCGPERPHDLNPDDPPVEWWVEGEDGPLRCTVLRDSTRGFLDSGEIELQVPELRAEQHAGLEAWWIRCRYVRKAASAYTTSPRIRIDRVDLVGASVLAAHEELIADEVLGRSDGSPGQAFQLRYHPILKRSSDEHLRIELPDGTVEQWEERQDFSTSMPDDLHYVLDSNTGLLQLPPILPTPDGQMHQLGRLPPRGALLVFSRYRHGGGVRGNVAPDTLVVLKASIPYVSRVTNPRAAVGGRDVETLEHARLRTIRALRSRDRAVTADDYVFLAEQMPGVARACCTGAGPVGREAEFDMDGGLVWVRVLPELPGDVDETELERLYQVPAWEPLRGRVEHQLNVLSVVGVRATVAQVPLVPIQVAVRYAPAGRFENLEGLEAEIVRRLSQYLSPYRGGPQQRGWPFGRTVRPAELRAAIERVGGLEFADVSVSSPATPGRHSGLVQAGKAGVALYRWALPLLVGGRSAIDLKPIRSEGGGW